MLNIQPRHPPEASDRFPPTILRILSRANLYLRHENCDRQDDSKRGFEIRTRNRLLNPQLGNGVSNQVRYTWDVSTEDPSHPEKPSWRPPLLNYHNGLLEANWAAVKRSLGAVPIASSDILQTLLSLNVI